MSTLATDIKRPAGQVKHRLFDVDEYHHMVQAGILDAKERVELISGEIYEMAPIGSRHASCVNRLPRLLTGAVNTQEYVVWSQNPVILANDTEVQPDIALLRARPDEYAESLPTADDARIVIEVADTSLRYDREVKSRLYAAAGVPEYWIVDLDNDTVIVSRTPQPDGYAHTRRLGSQEALASVTLDTEIPVAAVLYPAGHH